MLLSDPHFSKSDGQFMSRAIRLAKKGRYSTTPNPHVGCVIVDQNNKIVGEGFHLRAGLAHAEVNAIQQAGLQTLGSTAYVTLEPCAHTGKTGPCALALIQAKVAKVVIACTDINPEVAGKGIQILVDAGIDVALGLMEQEAQALNQHFFYRLKNNRPYVTLKLAASIDGKTALSNGESKWITSDVARKDVQRYRAGACAILTGADTIIADNPQLNVRVRELPDDISELFLLRQQQPLRVVIDSQNRLDKTFQVFNDGHRTLVYNLTSNPNFSDNTDSLTSAPVDTQHKHVSQVQVASITQGNRQFIDINAVMKDLAKRGINHVWVEAGATFSGVLFDNKLVNQLVLYQAPKLLGASGRGLTNAKSPSVLNQAVKGEVVETCKIGDDIRTIINFK